MSLYDPKHRGVFDAAFIGASVGMVQNGAWMHRPHPPESYLGPIEVAGVYARTIDRVMAFGGSGEAPEWGEAEVAIVRHLARTLFLTRTPSPSEHRVFHHEE
ncbi:MAG: hypothetical protein FWD12_08500, partial [Alphaproteobacteria bacterium]|nr:hypothetical protein [Alphaproteobacteria bacterium]